MLKKTESVSFHQPTNRLYRENSLYHFLKDNLSATWLSGYRIEPSRADRQALYITFPLPQDGETTFAGFQLMRQHLSVDQHVISDRSPLSRYFSPTHGTFEYESPSERRVVRAYFNRIGQCIDFKLKTYPMSPRSAEGVERAMSVDEEKRVRDLIGPCQDLLSRLLNQKSSEYIRLYQDSFRLDEELSRACAEKKTRVAKSKAEELIALTSKLTRYNDFKEDGRTIHLMGVLSTLDETQDPTSTERHSCATAEIEPEPITHPVLHDKKTKTQKARPRSARKELTEEIVLLVDQVVHLMKDRLDEPVCQQVLAVEAQLRTLDDLFLSLDFNTNGHAMDGFRDEQRRRLPVDKPLGDYFDDCVLNGDIESVSVLYPSFSQRLNIFRLSEMLVSRIKSKPENMDRLIDLADYFYEHSEIYRSFFLFKSQMIEYSQTAHFGYGCVFCFFKDDNLPAFKMALRHGVSPDVNQLMKGNKMFNLLQAIIMYYTTNPKLDYMHALFEYGAQVNFRKIYCQEAPHAMTQKIFKGTAVGKRLLTKGGGLMTDSSQDASDREYDKISQINHALTLASTLYAQSHPELIGMLAEQSSPEMVLLETSILLNLKAFCSRNIFIEKSPSCKIFRDKSACDAHSYEAIEHLQGTVNSDVPMDERGDYHIEYGFLFYLTKGITTEADQHLFDSANHLLARALQVYPCLALDEQRQIMENLSHRAMKLKHSNDVVAAISCHKSAQMAYTMIERKESSDRLAMVYSFANIATLLQTQSFFHVTGAYLQAREFLKMLPVSEFELIKDKPIVKFVIQQITKAESQAVTKERPLMTK